MLGTADSTQIRSSSQRTAQAAAEAGQHPRAATANGEHWKAERSYWRAQLAAWYHEHYKLDLHPLQDDDSSVPGAGLMAKIQGSWKSNPDAFFATSCRTVLDYLRELHDHGYDPQRFQRVLEFGVGTGRLLRHFLPFRFKRFGCDVTTEAVAFAQQLLGHEAALEITQLSPPLPYADGSFDFVYANSVFTHIQMEATPQWVAELSRVLRPGGALIVTVFEPNHYVGHLSPREFDQMEQGPGYLEWGSSDVSERFMYMTPWKLFAVWGESFEVLELRHHLRDQSHLIVRRR